jgi:hypothetical protein
VRACVWGGAGVGCRGGALGCRGGGFFSFFFFLSGVSFAHHQGRWGAVRTTPTTEPHTENKSPGNATRPRKHRHHQVKGHPGRIIKQGDIVFKAVQQNEQDIATLKKQLDPDTSNVAKERARQIALSKELDEKRQEVLLTIERHKCVFVPPVAFVLMPVLASSWSCCVSTLIMSVVCVCVRVCVCVCVRMRARACVLACVRACVCCATGSPSASASVSWTSWSSRSRPRSSRRPTTARCVQALGLVVCVCLFVCVCVVCVWLVRACVCVGGSVRPYKSTRCLASSPHPHSAICFWSHPNRKCNLKSSNPPSKSQPKPEPKAKTTQNRPRPPPRPTPIKSNPMQKSNA